MKKADKAWVTAFLLLCMFFLSAVFAVQGSLLTAMIDGYQLADGRQGTANTMAFAGGIAALLCAFAMQGRWRKRALIRASVVMIAAGLILMWLAPGYGMYVAAWFVTGFGLGLMDTLLSACMADMYSGKQAVLMMCLLHTAYGLSSVLSPMGYASLLSGGLEWKRVYLVIAAAGLMLLLGALIVRRVNRITDTEPVTKEGADLRRILPALWEGRLLWLTAAMFFHGVFLSGLNTWINRYADTLGGSIAVPAQSCVFLGVLLSRLLLPFLPIRPNKYVVAAGFLSGAALAVGLTFAGGWMLRGILIVSSLMFGALIPCVMTLGCERQKSQTLMVTTAIMLALYLGQAVSSPLIAALEAAVSLRSGMILCAACMALCSLCCLADDILQRRVKA